MRQNKVEKMMKTDFFRLHRLFTYCESTQIVVLKAKSKLILFQKQNVSSNIKN